MRLTIVGTGYVGLTVGTCFAEMGNTVTCVDTNKAKVDMLKRGIPPIYEPGLPELLQSNYREGRLLFTDSLADACDSQVFFIAVGTPPQKDGSVDLTYLKGACEHIGRNIKDYCVIVNKSTVPVGAADLVKGLIQKELDARNSSIQFDVVSNPEFLKQGAAVNDFMKPDRVIIGCESERAREVMSELYRPFTLNHERTIFMSVKGAEMTKYVANAFLATKISFINEVANICDLLGVDVESVRKGVGSDARIGYSFIYPGCGYGGSCFPKDVQALVHLAENNGFEPRLLHSVHHRNQEQKEVLFRKVVQRFGSDLSDKTFAIWGLSFKPGTDDMREAPSLNLINSLVGAGAKVKAFDPVAMQVSKSYLPSQIIESGQLELVGNQYTALENANAVALLTEWKIFRNPDFDTMKSLMAEPVIFDGRNQYDPAKVKSLGFEYKGIGQ